MTAPVITARGVSERGLIGPDGAGTSTLLEVLAGILRPTTGAVEVHRPTQAGPEALRQSCASLLAQPHPPDEVHVVARAA